jgi:hypothetical protein
MNLLSLTMRSYVEAREIPGNAIFFITYELAQMAFPRWVDVAGAGDGAGDGTGDGAKGRDDAIKHTPSTPATIPNADATCEAKGRTKQFWAQETLAAMACGGTAGSVFWVTMLPVDYVKTRYQIARPGRAWDLRLRGWAISYFGNSVIRV